MCVTRFRAESEMSKACGYGGWRELDALAMCSRQSGDVADEKPTFRASLDNGRKCPHGEIFRQNVAIGQTHFEPPRAIRSKPLEARVEAGSGPVNRVRADINAPDSVLVDVEDGAKITFDAYGVNRLTVGGRELVDFVGSKPGIERVFLEDLEYGSGAAFLAGRQLGQCSAERLGRAEMAVHSG